MESLRLLLLGAGALLLIAIAWFGRRRSRQAAGSALHELRANDSPPQTLEAATDAEAVRALPSMRVDARAPGVAAPLPVLNWGSGQPMGAAGASSAGDIGRDAVTDPEDVADHEAETGRATDVAGDFTDVALDAEFSAVVGPPAAASDEISARATTTRLPEQAFVGLNRPVRIEWPLESARRICALRVMPRIRDRFSGRELRLALEAQGLRHGPLGIYHLPDHDGVSLLCVASMAKPGMLDPQQMDFQSFSGVNLFIVLPGAEAAEQLVDRLVELARELCQRLDGRIHDDGGEPMGALRLAELRQQVSDEDYGVGARPAG